MRINVYSQELTDEVIRIEKVSNTGRPYVAAQLVLHSSPMLHHPPMDDDRSAVTFWLPSSSERLLRMAGAFHDVADIFKREADRAPGQQPVPPALRIDYAVVEERKRCLAWVMALRMGELDDVRSVQFGIDSGHRYEDDQGPASGEAVKARESGKAAPEVKR